MKKKPSSVRSHFGEEAWKNSIKIQLSDALWEMQRRARREGLEPTRYYAEMMHYLLEYAAFIGHERGIPLEDFSQLAEEGFVQEYERPLAKEKKRAP
jgi:hypothetical protein